MSDDLTIREGRLVDAVLDPKVRTQRQAGRIAGYGERSLDAVVSETLKRPKVQRALQRRRAEHTDMARAMMNLGRRIVAENLKEATKTDPVEAVRIGGALVDLGLKIKRAVGDEGEVLVSALDHALWRAVHLRLLYNGLRLGLDGDQGRAEGILRRIGNRLARLEIALYGAPQATAIEPPLPVPHQREEPETAAGRADP